MTESARILFAMFQGGGNIPLIMPVVARLVDRGHRVRVMAGPGVRHSRLSVSTTFRHKIGAAGAIHVYGGDFFAATHSQWDPERLLEEPYDVKRLLALFEESNRLHASA